MTGIIIPAYKQIRERQTERLERNYESLSKVESEFVHLNDSKCTDLKKS